MHVVGIVVGVLLGAAVGFAVAVLIVFACSSIHNPASDLEVQAAIYLTIALVLGSAGLGGYLGHRFAKGRSGPNP